MSNYIYDSEYDDKNPYSRESFWITSRGLLLKIKELVDTHLVTILHHISFTQRPPKDKDRWPRRDEYIAALKEEIKLRGIRFIVVDGKVQIQPNSVTTIKNWDAENEEG